MIEEILEIRQGVLSEVKRKMEVDFYFHCNVGEGHGLQSKEEIEKPLMRPSYCCLSIEEQETVNLRNAYSYLMSHSDENHGYRLLEESMLREKIGLFYGIFPETTTTRKQDRTATIPE